MELRFSPEEKEAFATMAAARGESVGEYVRESAALHLAHDEVMLRERQQAVRVRRLDQTPARPKPTPVDQDWNATAERANEARERLRVGSALLRTLRNR
jgi:hypothetical protein